MDAQLPGRLAERAQRLLVERIEVLLADGTSIPVPERRAKQVREELLAIMSGAAGEGLTDADVALLTDIITSQSGYELPQIRIIEVK